MACVGLFSSAVFKPVSSSLNLKKAKKIMKIFGESIAWLPDFSWYNIPKRGEIYQIM
jgi:hypothetical protein